MDNRTTVMIAAGGTGGHVFPGLALAYELERRNYCVHWLGTTAGIESKLVVDANIPLHFISIKGVRGKSKLTLLAAPINIFRSVLQAKRIIKRVKPALLVGLGGFVAGPSGVAARVKGIPLIIHEQNAVAGTTNKILAKFASKVLTAFPSTLGNGECIGNPVRSVFFPEGNKKPENNTISVLVVGGSRGARAINQLIPKTLKCLGEAQLNLKVFHQCGDALLQETLVAYKKLGVDVKDVACDQLSAGDCALVPFIDDMAAAFHWADLVICRAGALTVSELAAAGVGAIFIPFPHAIDDHQTRNAKCLVDVGAALMWQQNEIDEKILADALRDLFLQPEQLKTMGQLAQQYSKPDAVKQFADWCEKLITPTQAVE